MILIFVLGLVALRILYSVGEICYEHDWPRSTWKGLLIALGVLCIAVSAFGQAARVDIPLLTSGPKVPVTRGPLPQTLWVANSLVYVCTHPSATLAACQAAPITTYTDSTEGTTCPSATQMVQLPGNTCTASSGVTANVGFLYAGGAVDYWITSSYGSYGPFTINPPLPTGAFNAPQINAPLVCQGTSGNGAAYACSTSPIFTVTAGNPPLIEFIPDVASQANATLSVNGSSAATFYTSSGIVLATGTLATGSAIFVRPEFSCVGSVCSIADWIVVGNITVNQIATGGTSSNSAPAAALAITGATVTGPIGTSSQVTAFPGPVGAPSFVGSNVPVIVPSAAYSAACNGTTDDHVIIQAAINYAAANNRAIQVVGTCNIGSTTILVPSGTQWMNQTSATLLYSGTGFAVDARGSSYYVIQNLNVNESNDAGSGFAIGGGGFVTLNNNYANGPNDAGNTGVGLLIDSTTGWSNNFILNNNYMEIFKFPFKFQTSASTGSIANLITGSGNYAYCANPSGTPITGSIGIWVDGLHLGNGEASTLSQMALEHCALPYQIDNGAYGPSLNGDFEANTSVLGTVGNTYTGTIWNVVTGNGPPLVYVNGMLGNYVNNLISATLLGTDASGKIIPATMVAISSAANGILSSVTGTGAAELDTAINRTGGTASAWTSYLPASSTDLCFYSSLDALCLHANGSATFHGNIANLNGTVIPSTALGNASANGTGAAYVELVLTGATGTITGTVLSATCDSGTATVTGAVVGHPVAVSSTTGADVGAAFNLRASVTATGVVTVYVCGTGTPASLAFNVTVF